MKRTIYLVDPHGGGMVQTGNTIVVQHKLKGEVSDVDTEIEKISDPGELRVTQAALDQLGSEGVSVAFFEHLRGNWWSDDPDVIWEADESLERGDVIYNIDRARRIMCITYPGDNTTLITSEEY